jgi:hypothetical protein
VNGTPCRDLVSTNHINAFHRDCASFERAPNVCVVAKLLRQLNRMFDKGTEKYASCEFNPSWAAEGIILSICTFGPLARVYLIERGQLFHYMIACPCERVEIESQPMPRAHCGVRACEAKCAQNRLFESNNGWRALMPNKVW